jgi:hypothetical protein
VRKLRPLVGVRRLQLRLAERALARPFSRRASLALDRAIVALEEAERCDGFWRRAA